MRLLPLALSVALLPSGALALGGHDAVGCAGCHSTHVAKGDALAAVPPNTKLLDPRTGKPNLTLSALCLSCHADPEEGGRGVESVSNHFNHPFSVAKPNPKLARVPEDLLREGRFECIGCHDPHPSNPNYRYLRIPVTRSPTLAEFCTVCHPTKKARAAPPPSLFSTMDERQARPPAQAP